MVRELRYFSYLLVSQNDDGSTMSLGGDIIKHCFPQASTYPSSHYIGFDQHQPPCFWLDRDRNEGLFRTNAQGISFHLPSLWATQERAEEYTRNRDMLCRVPNRLTMHEKLRVESQIQAWSAPLPFYANKTDIYTTFTQLNELPTKWTESMWDSKYGLGGQWPRDVDQPQDNSTFPSEVESGPTVATDASSAVAAREARFAATVARQRTTQYSARDVCEDPHSYGPNFLSDHDGLFCEITTRTLFPVCAEKDEEDRACYDIKLQEIRELEDDEDDEYGDEDEGVVIENAAEEETGGEAIIDVQVSLVPTIPFANE